MIWPGKRKKFYLKRPMFTEILTDEGGEKTKLIEPNFQRNDEDYKRAKKL